MVLRLRGADLNAVPVRKQQLFLHPGTLGRYTTAGSTPETGDCALDENEGELASAGTEVGGVTRSYCGQLGKWANCQTAVFATYLGRGGTALVNQRRHQSRDWVSRNSHAGLQRRTEVQADTPFRTKPQLVLKMLAGLVGGLADSALGDLRRGLQLQLLLLRR